MNQSASAMGPPDIGPPAGIPPLPVLEELVRDNVVLMCIQVAMITVLFYDYVLTFSEEVERIWKRPMSGASILFLLNRYFTPMEVFVDAFITFNSDIAQEVCTHWVRFQGAGAIAVVGICELIMILRIYALYGGQRAIFGLLVLVFVVQITIQAYVTGQGIPVSTPLDCILVGRNSFFASFWIMPLITETFIFALTIWRAPWYLKRESNMPLLKVFLRDGILYFSVIFFGNVANVITFFVASGAKKALFAAFVEIMTSVMVGRLVLNLRSFHAQGSQHESEYSGFTTVPAGGTPRSRVYSALPPAMPVKPAAEPVPPPPRARPLPTPPRLPTVGERWLVGNLGQPLRVDTDYNWSRDPNDRKSTLPSRRPPPPQAPPLPPHDDLESAWDAKSTYALSAYGVEAPYYPRQQHTFPPPRPGPSRQTTADTLVGAGARYTPSRKNTSETIERYTSSRQHTRDDSSTTAHSTITHATSAYTQHTPPTHAGAVLYPTNSTQATSTTERGPRIEMSAPSGHPYGGWETQMRGAADSPVSRDAPWSPESMPMNDAKRWPPIPGRGGADSGFV